MTDENYMEIVGMLKEKLPFATTEEIKQVEKMLLKPVSLYDYNKASIFCALSDLKKIEANLMLLLSFED